MSNWLRQAMLIGLTGLLAATVSPVLAQAGGSRGAKVRADGAGRRPNIKSEWRWLAQARDIQGLCGRPVCPAEEHQCGNADQPIKVRDELRCGCCAT